MKRIVCACCGADDFVYRDGMRICQYCNSRYELEKDERGPRTSVVSLNSDIDRLLAKCKADPKNAKRYASLILDIDPTNREAKKYI